MKLTAVPRITLGLVSIGMGLLLAFDLLLHVFPREADLARAARTQLANMLSIQTAVLVQARDPRSVDRTLAAVRTLEPEIVSIGLRKADGSLLAQAGDHAKHWVPAAAIGGSLNELTVAIMSEHQRWGTLEISFRPVYRKALADWLASGPTQLLALFSLSAGLLYFVYLRRMLQHLDPSGAVPERVRGAFDALTEGVLIVDAKEHVLLANRSFQALSPASMRSGLVGRKASGLSWLQATQADATPWLTTMRTRQAVQGRPFRIAGEGATAEAAKVVLNCSPLLDEQQQVRGCLITIDDVTELERSHDQLMEVLADLAASKEQLELKNVELEELANRDTLSGCLNRRAFFVGLERLYRQATTQGSELICIMADIDHFKSINDRFGHAVGDEAIQAFAEVLRDCAQQGDLVGRYGGEEFCVAVPGTALPRALQIAEAMRLRLAAVRSVGKSSGLDVPMTASFGVSSVRHGAPTAAGLVDHADRAMYVAKHGGRNRVVAFDPAEQECELAEVAS